MSDVEMNSMQIVDYGQPMRMHRLPRPTPTGREVLIRVTRCGMCHTDIHMWQGHYDLGAGRRFSLRDRGIEPPITPGHEVFGVVVAMGPEARGVGIGQRGVVFSWIGCGGCEPCHAGEEQLCASPRSLGVFRPGGYGEYVLIPDGKYVFDTAGIDDAQAATLACSGLTAYSALRQIVDGARPGEWTALLGAGGVGLAGLAIAQAMGLQRTVVFDLDTAKREAALRAGATLVADPRSADEVARVRARTEDRIFGTIDFVGLPQTFELGTGLVRRGGRYVLVGLFGGQAQIALPTLPFRNLTIIGSYVGSLAEMHELVALVRDRKPSLPPVTHRPLADANAALDDLINGRVVGRIVLDLD